MSEPSRRGLLKSLALGAAVVATPAAAGAAPSSRRDIFSKDSDAPWWLLHPLAPGASLSGGYTVMELSPVRKGAAVLTLQHGLAERVDVHLCVHDGAPKGVVHTELVDLIVMDGGQGKKRTDEALGRALMDLGTRISKNQAGEGADLAPLSRMMPHVDRVEAFGPENL